MAILAQLDKLITRDTQTTVEGGEVTIDQGILKVVMPCWHRRMHRIERRGAYHLQCYIKGQAPILHQIDQSLHVHKGRMPLVHVIHIARNAELLEEHRTTDA